MVRMLLLVFSVSLSHQEDHVVPLEQYKNDYLLINSNFLSETGTDGVFGYRGGRVLIEGEAGDAKGYARPPVEVLRGSV